MAGDYPAREGSANNENMAAGFPGMGGQVFPAAPIFRTEFETRVQLPARDIFSNVFVWAGMGGPVARCSIGHEVVLFRQGLLSSVWNSAVVGQLAKTGCAFLQMVAHCLTGAFRVLV